MEAPITFRKLEEADLAVLGQWLVSDFVSAHITIEDTSPHGLRQRYISAINGSSSLKCFIINLDGHPIGFIQSFPFFELGNPASSIFEYPERVWGFDLFLARADLAGRGMGSMSLRRYLNDFIFGAWCAEACVATPNPMNIAAVKAYNKLGFEPVQLDNYPNARILWKRNFRMS